MVHSLAGKVPEGGLVTQRPYRDPHHSASLPALVGGGPKERKPGEISLCHRGVLFLDELPEFKRDALEALRQPIENGEVTISRAAVQTTYPAKFQLVAAMNPCRCGLSQPDKPCNRGPKCSEDYLAKISGPLMDRIDLVVEMPPVKISDLGAPATGEASADVRKRVEAARARQYERLCKGL